MGGPGCCVRSVPGKSSGGRRYEAFGYTSIRPGTSESLRRWGPPALTWPVPTSLDINDEIRALVVHLIAVQLVHLAGHVPPRGYLCHLCFAPEVGRSGTSSFEMCARYVPDLFVLQETESFVMSYVFIVCIIIVLKQSHPAQSVSRLAVWFVLLQCTVKNCYACLFE